MNIPDNDVLGERALKSALSRVYDDVCKAFETMDIEAALSSFADGRDMVKISNGEMLRGKSALAESWRRRLGGERRVRIRIDNLEVHRIDERHAWATADEYISIGAEHHRAIVSNIFVRVGAEWKILLDHTTYVQS